MIVYEYEKYSYGKYSYEPYPYEGLGDWLSSAWHTITSVVTKPIKVISNFFHHEEHKPSTSNTSSSLAASFAHSAGLSLGSQRPKGFESLHQSLLKDLHLPSLSKNSSQSLNLSISKPSSSSGGGSLLSSFAKHVKLEQLENPGIFKITSHNQVNNPFLQALGSALKTVGHTIIQASTQALAQGIAFKIQKELGLVPKIHPAPTGGYQIIVERPPSYSPPPQPTSTQYYPPPSATPPTTTVQGHTSKPITASTVSSSSGFNLTGNNKLLLIGGLLLIAILLSSRR